MNIYFLSIRKRIRALPVLGFALSISYGIFRKLRGDPRLLVQAMLGLHLRFIAKFLRKYSLVGGVITSTGEYYLRMHDDIFLYYNYSIPSLTIGDGQGLESLDTQFKSPLEEFVISFMKENEVYLDVGANSGYYFALKVAQSNAHAKIFAFEPDPKILFHLRKNIQINNAKSIMLFEMALGDTCGSFPMTAELGASNFLVAQTGLISNTIKVDVQTLDVFAKKCEIDRIDLIKVDIEGREFDFLKGATVSISEFRPVLILELNDSLLQRGGSSLSQVLTHLYSKKYYCYRVKNSNDALCFPSEKLEQFFPKNSVEWLEELK